MGVNIIVFASSLIVSRRFFRESGLFSVRKGLIDVGLVGLGVYASALVVASGIESDVSKSKRAFFESYDSLFMRHFDILAAKYEIDEEVQTQGIFSQAQLA